MYKDLDIVEMQRYLVRMKMDSLKRKQHVKKYTKVRELYSEIVDNMQKYILNNEYDLKEKSKVIYDDIQKELGYYNYKFKVSDSSDMSIIYDSYIYKTHPKLESVVEIYLKNNKYEKEEYIKMMKAMNDSYVGLFKIIETDSENGYVTLEDVFTKKRFKTIDIALSTTINLANINFDIYCYNRIITYGGVSFGTGINAMALSKNKLITNFIENHKYDEHTDFARGLMFYRLAKKYGDVVMTTNVY